MTIARFVAVAVATLSLYSCASSAQTDKNLAVGQGGLPPALTRESENIRVRKQSKPAMPPRVRVPDDALWLLEPVDAAFTNLAADAALRFLVRNSRIRFDVEATTPLPNVSHSPDAVNRLDHINSVCAQANLAWRVSKGVLIVSDFVTQQFDIETPIGQNTAQLGSGQLGGGALGGSSDQSNVTIVQTNSMQELLASVREALGAEESETVKVSVTPSSGQLTVTGRPDDVDQAEQMVENYNERLRRRVQIEFVLYEIDVSDIEERNLNLSAIRNAAVSGGVKFATSSASNLGSGELSLTFAEGNSFDGSSVLLSWLQRLGDTEITIRKRVVATNQNIVTLRDVETSRYVSQVSIQRQSNGATDTTSPTVEISELNTGEHWAVLPSIDEDRVHLRLAVSRAQVVGFDDYSFDDGSIAGRLPQSATDEIVVPISLRDGETRLITNLSSEFSSTTGTSTPMISRLLPFFGSKGRSDRKIESIVAVTVHILRDD